MDRREFLNLITVAVAPPPTRQILEPSEDIAGPDFENYWWIPWVQYIEPGKAVTFDYPFHLRSLGVDAPGAALPTAQCELLVNGKSIAKTAFCFFIDHGRAMPVFPTIAIPAGTNIEVRCLVPDVVFCAQGDMKRPGGPDFEYDEDEDEDDEEDEFGLFDQDDDEDEM